MNLKNVNEFAINYNLYIKIPLTLLSISLVLWSIGFFMHNLVILSLFFSFLGLTIFIYIWKNVIVNILVFYILILLYLTFPASLFEDNKFESNSLNKKANF
jgi:hypothetical protein